MLQVEGGIIEFSFDIVFSCYLQFDIWVSDGSKSIDESFVIAAIQLDIAEIIFVEHDMSDVSVSHQMLGSSACIYLGSDSSEFLVV